MTLLTWLGHNPSTPPSNGQEPAQLVEEVYSHILPTQDKKQNQATIHTYHDTTTYVSTSHTQGPLDMQGGIANKAERPA
jgi:hypothetical protein